MAVSRSERKGDFCRRIRLFLSPDFEDQAALIEGVEQGVIAFYPNWSFSNNIRENS